MSEIIILFFLLVLSGVFSGSETALISLTLARAEALLHEGRKGARALVLLKRKPTRMLITILIGNNVVNIGASALATVVATQWLGHMGPGIAVGVLTVLILVFGEITPKSLATRYAERISLFISPPLYSLMQILSPLVWLFDQLTKKVQQATRGTADPTVTESELISLAEFGEVEGTIESGEREMIERVFILNDLKAADVMTPRGDVFVVKGDRIIRDALVDILSHPYTRIPLYEKDPAEVSHVLYLRDLLDALARGEDKLKLLDVAHKPFFCVENQPIDELLPILRKRKQHLAVVVDEHGAMQGVMTLEDLLEELVGEIYDESDELPHQVVRLDSGGILVEGGAELRVVESFFDIDLPGKPTDTVNLWILSHTERIPTVDEHFLFDGLEVKVQAATSSRIEQVLLAQLTPADDAGA